MNIKLVIKSMPYIEDDHDDLQYILYIVIREIILDPMSKFLYSNMSYK